MGAALAFWYQSKKKKDNKKSDSMKGSYLGPSYKNEEIVNDLKKIGARYKKLEDSKLVKLVSNYIKNGKAVGWFSGKMEFGPRSLGAESILASLKGTMMQKS